MPPSVPQHPKSVAEVVPVRHGEGVSARLVALSIDANDPLGLAHFWADTLRWELDERADEIALVPPDDTTFPIVFRRVPEAKAGRNRIHLDLTTSSLDDQRNSVSRAIDLGARHLDIGQGPDEPH